jgi:hypothetical protein
LKIDDAEPPSKNNGKSKKAKAALTTGKTVNIKWALTILGWTCLLSMLMSFLASNALEHVGSILAMLLLAAFILLGILFDIIGIATATAAEKPFHSMAARRVNGSVEAIQLIKNAEKVSSFCNDVVGDITGIISGTTSAVIVTRISGSLSVNTVLLQLLFSGIVAGLTVGGKAVGKSFALGYSTNIVFFAGRMLFFLNNLKMNLRIKK